MPRLYHTPHRGKQEKQGNRPRRHATVASTDQHRVGGRRAQRPPRPGWPHQRPRRESRRHAARNHRNGNDRTPNPRRKASPQPEAAKDQRPAATNRPTRTTATRPNLHRHHHRLRQPRQDLDKHPDNGHGGATARSERSTGNHRPFPTGEHRTRPRPG